LVPEPAVIVPFVRFQTYAAPTPASATEAVWPVDDAQTEAASTVIEDDGDGVIVTFAEDEDAQLAALVTVTLIPTGDVVPAVYVIEFVPAPAVIVPLVRFQT
jgi:hypothetical protein